VHFDEQVQPLQLYFLKACSIGGVLSSVAGSSFSRLQDKKADKMLNSKMNET
jgi:hypothetical protein